MLAEDGGGRWTTAKRTKMLTSTNDRPHGGTTLLRNIRTELAGGGGFVNDAKISKYVAIDRSAQPSSAIVRLGRQ